MGTLVSARDDYPFPAAVADGRVDGGAYGRHEMAAALDEIDRLRSDVCMLLSKLADAEGLIRLATASDVSLWKQP